MFYSTVHNLSSFNLQMMYKIENKNKRWERKGKKTEIMERPVQTDNVQFQKISILPHRRDWNFLGMGVLEDQKI